MTVYNNEVRYRITVYDIRAGSSFSPYTNATFGINSGTWIIYNTDDLLTKVDNPVQKINISKGGNFATGYSFGFEVTNFDLVKDILADGVFFKNLKVTFEIGFVTGISTSWSTEWTGVIDTFTRVSELKASWRCVDAGKNRNEKIGSKEIPIALNRNYNCKLVPDEKRKYKYISKTKGLISTRDAPIQNKDIEKQRILVAVHSTGEWASVLASDTQAYLEVSMGGGAGTIFKIYSYEVAAPSTFVSTYWFYVNEDVSGVISSADSVLTPVNMSVVRLVSFLNTGFLSQKQVKNIHSNQNSTNEKVLTVNQNDIDFSLSSPDDYYGFLNSNNNQQISIKSVNESNAIENYSLLGVDQDFTQLYVTTDGFACFSDLSSQSLSEFDSIAEKKQSIFSFLSELEATNFGNLPTSGSIKFTLVAYYKEIVTPGGKSVTIIQTGEIPLEAQNFSLSGSDLKIDTGIVIDSNLSTFEMNNYLNSDSLASMRMIIQVKHDSTSFNAPSGYLVSDFGMKYGGVLNGSISIGCNGENVQAGNQFESVGDTIEYIQENYGNVDSLDINDASYAQSDSDFELLPSSTIRNPAHQITSQTDLNTLLKDLLYSHHLGLYFGRNGQYYLKNWLPESTVFFNGVLPVASFTEANYIDISDIRRDNLNTIASDYELNYDLNEATGEYQKTIRIKNTGESTFDFNRDTEGVSSQNATIAEQAWDLLSAGYKRIRKESQTSHDNNWIKASNSDGTGEGEALCFIRNQVGHINREHEYLSITISYNSTNLALELLSFISVRDLKVTSNVERLGWVIERKINTKKDLIELKLLLDISATDPFLVEIGVVQDDANEVGNEWLDDSTAVDEITDGDGI